MLGCCHVWRTRIGCAGRWLASKVSRMAPSRDAVHRADLAGARGCRRRRPSRASSRLRRSSRSTVSSGAGGRGCLGDPRNLLLTLPRPDACRVLEHMLGRPVPELFSTAYEGDGGQRRRRGARLLRLLANGHRRPVRTRRAVRPEPPGPPSAAARRTPAAHRRPPTTARRAGHEHAGAEAWVHPRTASPGLTQTQETHGPSSPARRSFGDVDAVSACESIEAVVVTLADGA
jgi:hypothetical protein